MAKYEKFGDDWLTGGDSFIIPTAWRFDNHSRSGVNPVGGRFSEGNPLSGSAGSDFLLARNAGLIYGLAGDDLVLGDMINGLYLVSSGNSSFASAINVDGTWTLDENPLVGDDTIPHMTFHVTTAAGTQEYFVLQMNAGDTITVDIDAANGTLGSAVGTDTLVDLFVSTDLQFSLITNDDSSAALGGFGSVSDTDSYFSYTVSVTGTYYIRVREFGFGDGNVFEGDEEFLLNVSVTGHATGFAFGGSPDTINGGDGADHLFGMGGNDSIYGDAGSDLVHGGSGNDSLYGDADNDTISGAAGNDWIQGGAGFDFLDGGDGERDTLSYRDSAIEVEVNLATGITSGGDASGDSITRFEDLEGSGLNDTLTGDSIANVINGLSGNDLVFGAGGNDTLVASSGTDTLDGGADTDTLDHTAWGGAYQFDMTTGLSNIPDEMFINFENATMGNGNDTVTGTDEANNITGNGGDDRQIGGGGDDTLAGGLNDDILFGGGGGDQLQGDGGNDRLNGNNGGDTLQGGDGNDSLIDKVGGDRLQGGDGDDKYVDTTGTAVIVELAGQGYDTVKTAVSYTLPTNVEELILVGGGKLNGTGNELGNVISSFGGNNLLKGLGGDDSLFSRGGEDTLQGGIGNDTLRGGGGSDSLDGGANDDRLFGQKGNDTLTGGSGADRFIFTDDSQFDTVTDFGNGNDLIQLNDYREENGGAPLTFDQLLLTQRGTDTRIELDLDRNGIADVIDLDGDGTGDAWRITLENFNATDLTAADFVF